MTVTVTRSVPMLGGMWAGAVCSGGNVDYCIWLDPASGMRAFEVKARGEGTEALGDLLMRAVYRPEEGHSAGRPASVVVGSKADARGLAAIAKDLGIKVEIDRSMADIVKLMVPMLDALEETRGFGYLDIEGVTDDLVKRFFTASAAFAAGEPWRFTDDTSFVCLDGLTEERLYVSILGAADEVYGASIYLSEQAASRILSRQAMSAILENPILFFDLSSFDETPRSALEEARRKGWPLHFGYPVLRRTDRAVDNGAPTADEMLLATTVLEIIAGLPLSAQRGIDGEVCGRGGEVVQVAWPTQPPAATRRTGKKPKRSR